MSFQIISDSSCDLPESIMKENNIEIVPFFVSFDGVNYLREGVEVDIVSFYRQMWDNPGVYPKTSMPSMEDYANVFNKYAKEGIDVLCICLTSTFTSSIQSALNAKAFVLESYPHARIEIMDSQLVTAVQGMFVQEAAQLKSEGFTLDEAIDMLKPIRSSGKIFFTANDLDYLQNGGRIGKAAAHIGTALNLKPLVMFSDKELHSLGVSRGRKKALLQVLEKSKAYIESNKLDLTKYRLGGAFGHDTEEFAQFLDYAKSEIKKYDGLDHQWTCFHVGATIGVHTGPTPVGIGILKRCER